MPFSKEDIKEISSKLKFKPSKSLIFIIVVIIFYIIFLTIILININGEIKELNKFKKEMNSLYQITKSKLMSTYSNLKDNNNLIRNLLSTTNNNQQTNLEIDNSYSKTASFSNTKESDILYKALNGY